VIAAWIAYGLVVSAFLCLAATLAERAFRSIGVPTRWTWAVALCLGWCLPSLGARSSGSGSASSLLARPLGSTVHQSGDGWIPFLATARGRLVAGFGETWEGVASMAAVVDWPLLLIWVGAAGLLLSALAITYRRLRIRADAWPVRNLYGHRVRISEDLGPAVLGVRRGEVVLPRWTLECPPGHRRLIVLHEAEHLRAGDERLLFAALIAVALMPWNLFAWWQLRRLRLAVELDCDSRVLGTGVQVRQYASLLLEAGSRRAASPMTAAAFVHFHSQLGRRIREMTENRKGPRYLPAALSAMGALVLLSAACETPAPTDPADVAELTYGKQVSHVDPLDASELHRALEQQHDVSLVIEEADGDTYVVDHVKLAEIRESGHSKALIEKLRQHGDVQLTLVHEDGTESASFGVVLEKDRDPASNEFVELKAYPGEYRFGSDETSTLRPREEGAAAEYKAQKAAREEAKKGSEGESR